MSLSRAEIEKNHDGFQLQGLYQAQEKSWNALAEIRKRIQPGMTEAEAVNMMRDLLLELGSARSWHHPKLKFGKSSAGQASADSANPQVLKENDIFYIDIGPTWLGDDGVEYEGDVGDTFQFQENQKYQDCIDASHWLFQNAVEFWRSTNATGPEIDQWIQKESQKLGFPALTNVDGHRIGSFPHKELYRGGLKTASFQPSSGLWILEVHISDPECNFGAFYEDILR